MPKMMLWLLLLNAAEAKKRGKKKNRCIQKKVDDSRIWSQIKNRKHICERKNTWRIFYLRFLKLILIVMSITKKKIQVDENEHKYILFRIDVYFAEYVLDVDIDEKGHTTRELIFEEKRQDALEKKLGCKLIRINTSKRLWCRLWS